MDLSVFIQQTLFSMFGAYYEGPITLLFLVYLIWDWHRTKEARLSCGSQAVIFGLKQATVAWFMKIVMTYFLVLLVYYNLPICFRIGKELYQAVVHGVEPSQSIVQFFGQHITTPVQSQVVESTGSAGSNREAQIYILDGAIQLTSSIGFYITMVDHLFGVLYKFSFYILLLLIFQSLSIQSPFPMANVKRLRLLAISLIVYKIMQSGIRLFSNWYVKSHVVFESNEPMSFKVVSHENLLLFLSLLLIAEVIRYGAQLKADQDLTV